MWRLILVGLVVAGCGGNAAISAPPTNSPTARPTVAAATTRPTVAPTPQATLEIESIEHMVAFIDELAGMDADDVVQAILDEGGWLADHAEVLTSPEGTLYFNAIIAALGDLESGADASDNVALIVAMREDLAALVPGGVQAAKLEMKVAEKGYTAFGGDTPYLSFGVVLENPNRDTHVAERVTVTVTLLDAEGAVITTDDEYIDNALPGQKVAVGGTMFDSAGVKSMEVEVSADWIEVDFVPGAFTFDKVRLRSDEYESRATGTVGCTFSEDQENVEVVAIFRSKAGKVVGGDSTYVETVRCSKGSAFEVSTLGRLTRATKVDMYAAS